MEKVKVSYPKCQQKGCNKKAVFNLQTQWHLYSIRPGLNYWPEYTEKKSWEGDDNEFWCQKHYDESMGIIN